MPTEFWKGTNWQQESSPQVNIDAQESDCWPVDDNSISGAKDQLAEGLHPIVALGARTVADGRPLNPTGVVVSYQGTGGGTGTDRVLVNIAKGYAVRNYVANIKEYDDIVYEICRIIYEHAEEFALYHVAGKMFNKEKMGLMAYYDPAGYHPGAVRFYKEHNIEMGELVFD